MGKGAKQRKDDEAEKRLLESLDRGPGTIWKQELTDGIIREGTTRGSYAHGPYREWFSNQQPRLERFYRRGELHGVCRQYTPEGKLVAEFTMNEGDGILLECWDTGILKIRWWNFHVTDKPCYMMELFDINGEHPIRSYCWKGGPCRTRKRFLGELAKCGLVLPAPDKINDPAAWAAFALAARHLTPRSKA